MCDLRVCHLLGTRWVLLFCSPLHLLCPWKTRTPIFVRIRTNVALTIKRGKTRMYYLFHFEVGHSATHTHLLLNRVHHFHARSSHRMSSSYKLLNRRVMDPSGASKRVEKPSHVTTHGIFYLSSVYSTYVHNVLLFVFCKVGFMVSVTFEGCANMIKGRAWAVPRYTDP